MYIQPTLNEILSDVYSTHPKASSYQREGNWDKALESYRQALALEKNDPFAVALARKAQEVMDFQLNLGAKQGVVPGTKFEVLEEGEAVLYKGKVLSSAPRPVAHLEAVRVEPDLCYGKVLKQYRPLKGDDKVQEKMEEIALR